MKGQISICKILLKLGFNVNEKDKACLRIPLHYACESNNTEIVILLLRNGAKLDIGDGGGNYPLHIACLHGSKKVIPLLKGGIHIRDGINGCIPLTIACKKGYKDIVEILLKMGSKVNDQDKACLRTPLHWSAHNGYKEIVKLLLSNGASKTIMDGGGKTALDLAMLHNKVEVIPLLK